MFFYNNNQKERKKERKLKLKVISHLDIKTINFFLNKYPQLSAGRKNYMEKEIIIAKNICLTKLFKKAKKINARYINNIYFKQSTNKITATAVLILQNNFLLKNAI